MDSPLALACRDFSEISILQARIAPMESSSANEQDSSANDQRLSDLWVNSWVLGKAIMSTGISFPY